MPSLWSISLVCEIPMYMYTILPNGGVLIQRRASIFGVGIGGVISTVLGKVLKYMFQEKRPTGVAADPGMPSSHSMNLFYFATYLCTYVDEEL